MMAKNILIFIAGLLTGCIILITVFVVVRFNSKYVIHRPLFKTPRLSLKVKCQADFDTVQIVNNKNIILNNLTNLKGLDQFILSYDKIDDYPPFKIITTKGFKKLEQKVLFKPSFIQTLILYEDSISINMPNY